MQYGVMCMFIHTVYLNGAGSNARDKSEETGLDMSTQIYSSTETGDNESRKRPYRDKGQQNRRPEKRSNMEITEDLERGT